MALRALWMANACMKKPHWADASRRQGPGAARPGEGLQSALKSGGAIAPMDEIARQTKELSTYILRDSIPHLVALTVRNSSTQYPAPYLPPHLTDFTAVTCVFLSTTHLTCTDRVLSISVAAASDRCVLIVCSSSSLTCRL